MSRRWVVSFAVLVMLAGCKRDNPAFGSDGTGTSTATGHDDETDGGASGTGAGTGQSGDGGTAATSTGGTGTTGATDTGKEACDPPSLGFVNAEVSLAWQEPGLCEGEFEKWARVDSGQGGTWSMTTCAAEGCAECAGETFTLSIQAPSGHVPTLSSECVRVHLEQSYPGDGEVCEFTALTLWEPVEAFGQYAPVYVASSKKVSPPLDVVFLSRGLAVRKNWASSCACEACCEGAASQYTLEFELGEQSAMLEATAHADLTVESVTYRATNLQSHGPLTCGGAPGVDWTLCKSGTCN